MIGSGLKKLAAEYGMKVDKGVAYGSMQGYAATMREGSGWKQIVFATSIADPMRRDEFTKTVNDSKAQKTYRIRQILLTPHTIQLVFNDTVGTMNKIREFLAWFMPLLQEYGASGWNTCHECGCEATDGKWMLIEGVAYYMHSGCAEKAIRDIGEENERRAQEDTGSYLSGTVGALLGSALGAVVWAIVLMLGYMASIVGLLIGWLSDRGYRLLKGKNGKGKVAILILSVIFGVVAGTIGADVITLLQMIGNGELPGIVAGDIPVVMLTLFIDDPEYRAITLKNIAMGLLFAALGVYYFVFRTGKEVADAKIVELK
jgi:hypothetical protein